MSGMSRISRRDFMNGVAISLAAGTSISPLELLALDKKDSPYPPARTGLRGNHPGSFEVAHSVARDGAEYPRPSEQTDSDYDLVVVGGGLSGLAAALFYRQRVGPETRIVVLDNHDDFGGHAKRNEHTINGKTRISYGGSQTLVEPQQSGAIVGPRKPERGERFERRHLCARTAGFSGLGNRKRVGRRNCGAGYAIAASSDRVRRRRWFDHGMPGQRSDPRVFIARLDYGCVDPNPGGRFGIRLLCAGTVPGR